MIRYTENKKDIISLWAQAFGDTIDEISFFIDNVRAAKCLAYYDNEKILSMLFLVECFYNGKKGEYIYAACTENSSKKRGLMTQLLDYAKRDAESFLCLIPANENLIGFYKKRNFNQSVQIDAVRFEQTDDIKDYLYDGCSLSNPFILMCKGE